MLQGRAHPRVGHCHGQVGLDPAGQALLPTGQGLLHRVVRPSHCWVMKA